MIKSFYQLEHHSNLRYSDHNRFKDWIQFKSRWDKLV
jgi:hypothetical protein